MARIKNFLTPQWLKEFEEMKRQASSSKRQASSSKLQARPALIRTQLKSKMKLERL